MRTYVHLWQYLTELSQSEKCSTKKNCEENQNTAHVLDMLDN
jgi:hypothetical protein